MQFIEGELTDGNVQAKKIIAHAKQMGIADRTLKRAKKKLRIRSFKQGESWVWEWEKTDPPSPL